MADLTMTFAELKANPVCDICNGTLTEVNDALYCEKCKYRFIVCQDCGGIDYCGPCEVADGKFKYAINAHGGCDICDIGYEMT